MLSCDESLVLIIDLLPCFSRGTAYLAPLLFKVLAYLSLGFDSALFFWQPGFARVLLNVLQ